MIFCPKYRRNVLVNGIDNRLKEVFLEIANTYGFEILEMEVMPNHVHLLIDCDPKFGIHQCISKLKGISSNTMRKEFPSLKKKIPSLWTRSAFVSTVGSVSLETVKQYIESQKNM